MAAILLGLNLLQMRSAKWWWVLFMPEYYVIVITSSITSAMQIYLRNWSHFKKYSKLTATKVVKTQLRYIFTTLILRHKWCCYVPRLFRNIYLHLRFIVCTTAFCRFFSGAVSKENFVKEGLFRRVVASSMIFGFPGYHLVSFMSICDYAILWDLWLYIVGK